MDPWIDFQNEANSIQFHENTCHLIIFQAFQCVLFVPYLHQFVC
jgi:hypothetical protein